MEGGLGQRVVSLQRDLAWFCGIGGIGGMGAVGLLPPIRPCSNRRLEEVARFIKSGQKSTILATVFAENYKHNKVGCDECEH